MIDFDVWLAYVIAAAIILVIPGPTIILVISQAITHGKRSVIPLVTGVICGDLTCMTLSLLGLGALLSVSATLFIVLKWVGALYLFYLGITMWRRKEENRELSFMTESKSKWTLFKSSYIVTALNPKGVVFFVAFLPQFVTPQNPAWSQLLVLGTTFLILAGINAGLYAVFSGQMRDFLQSGRSRRWLDRCGGTALIGAGIVTAAMKRSS